MRTTQPPAGQGSTTICSEPGTVMLGRPASGSGTLAATRGDRQNGAGREM